MTTGTIRVTGIGTPQRQQCDLCDTPIEAPPVWQVEGWGFHAGQKKWHGEICDYCLENHDGPTQHADDLDEDAAFSSPSNRFDEEPAIVINRDWRRGQNTKRPRTGRSTGFDPGDPRAHELARELGMTSRELLQLAAELGIVARTPSSKISGAHADRIRRKAEREGLIREVQPGR